jgi:hypothetical protein
MSISFTTTPRCPEEKISSLAATLQGNQMINKYKFIKWKQVDYKTEYIATSETFRKLTQNTTIISKQYQSSCKSFSSSKLENCPKIVLTSDEFNEIANERDISSMQVNKLNADETIEICVDDFEAITTANICSSVSTDIIFVLFSALVGFVL